MLFWMKIRALDIALKANMLRMFSEVCEHVSIARAPGLKVVPLLFKQLKVYGT